MVFSFWSLLKGGKYQQKLDMRDIKLILYLITSTRLFFRFTATGKLELLGFRLLNPLVIIFICRWPLQALGCLPPVGNF